MTPPLLEIDVAHPPRTGDEVEQELLEAWSRVRNSTELRILKIIHGYGSSGKGGTTRDLVRNWAFRNRAKFRAVIEGEAYDVFDPVVLEMRDEVGKYVDSDLGRGNSGLVLIWVK